MNELNNSKRNIIRNLTIFTVTVLLVGWIGHWVDVLLGNPSSGSLGMLIWIVTPLVACLILRAFAGGGWRDFGVALNFKKNIFGYIFSILIFPFIAIFILVVGKISGSISFPDFSSGALVTFLQVFTLGLLPAFFKNIFEEFAWRGYLTPKVYSLKLNDYVGHLIVGLIWALWHIPYFLFFLDRVIIRDYTSLSLVVFVPLALVVIISYSLVFGEIRLLTNSIWPVVLMHAVEDAFINPLLVEKYIEIKPGMDLFFSPGVSILVVILFIVTGIFLHRLRCAKEKVEVG
jgi:membrane protease YdiL (CAAX protease family)